MSNWEFGSTAARGRGSASRQSQQARAACHPLTTLIAFLIAIRPSARPSVGVLGGLPADVPLSHVLGDRGSRAGLGIAKAAASRFHDAHALPGRQLVAALGMHGLAVDGVHPQGTVTA